MNENAIQLKVGHSLLTGRENSALLVEYLAIFQPFQAYREDNTSVQQLITDYYNKNTLYEI
jgi:hypothetical protein